MKLVFGLLVVLCTGMMMVTYAFAEIPSPLAQYKDGIPIEQIECRGDRILLKQPHSDKPACVFPESVEKLLQRGFVVVEIQTGQNQNAEINETQPLLRQPFEIPLLDIDYVGEEGEDYMVWTEMSHSDLIAAKTLNVEAHASSTESETPIVFDDSKIESWVPNYIPNGYKIGYTLFSSGEYNNQTKYEIVMQLVPSSFNYTSTTTESDVWESGGIFYHSSIIKSTEHYDSVDDLQHMVDIGWVVVDQTNELFGLKTPDNDIDGFGVRAIFPDYELSITSYSLNNAEGIKILNSIRGAIFPE